MIHELKIQSSKLTAKELDDLTFYIRQFNGPFGFTGDKTIPVYLKTVDMPSCKFNGRIYVGHIHSISIIHDMNSPSCYMRCILVINDDKFDLLSHMVRLQERLENPKFDYSEVIEVTELIDYRMSIDMIYTNMEVNENHSSSGDSI